MRVTTMGVGVAPNGDRQLHTPHTGRAATLLYASGLWRGATRLMVTTIKAASGCRIQLVRRYTKQPDVIMLAMKDTTDKAMNHHRSLLAVCRACHNRPSTECSFSTCCA